MPMSLKTHWYDKTIDALQLARISESTQESHARPVRMLIEHFGKAPARLPKGSSMPISSTAGMKPGGRPAHLKSAYVLRKGFFINVLQQDWQIFKILKAQPEKRLPCVLSRKEVYHILRYVKTFHNSVFQTTVYSCCLRLQEALFLEVSDIDSHWMLIHVQRGKGAKDRFVPLPEDALILLRKYWKTHRHPRLLFPAMGRGHNKAPHSDFPMAIDSYWGLSAGPNSRWASKRDGFPFASFGIHTPLICWNPASISG